MIRCLHQVFRPEGPFLNVAVQGRGNCSLCTPDEKNKECSGYYPISIKTFEVCERKLETLSEKLKEPAYA